MSNGTLIEDLLIDYVKPDSPLRAAIVYELSGLSRAGVSPLATIWSKIPSDRKERLMTRLVEASESDSDLDFVEFARFAVQDENSGVRRDAVNLMWTSEDVWVLDLLLDRAINDVSTDVRAAAAGGIGRFVLLGELGEFPKELAVQAEATLLRILAQSQPTSDVYRRALESIAYSGNTEVTKLIKSASSHPNIELQASAICAMGRSGDERWSKDILSALESQEPELRFEATRAAGELEIDDAVPILIDQYRDQDREIKEAVIWALGEIGGSDPQEFLTTLLTSERDEDLISEIEDALTVASLSSVNLRPPESYDAL